MSLQLAAQHMASRGRGPDTTLVHMAPQEVAGLQALAKAHGGSLTVNPDTGLPEAGFLSSILPMVAGAALTATGIGAPMAAMIVGGGMTAATGSLQKGLMAGLGAYGGAGLASGLMGAGAAGAAEAGAAGLGAMGPQTAAQLGTGLEASLAAQGVAPTLGATGASMGAQTAGQLGAGFQADMAAQGIQPSAINADLAVKNAVPTITKAPTPGFTDNVSQMFQGAKNLGEESGRAAFMDKIGGTKGLMQYGLMGLAPVAADMLTPKQRAIEEQKKLKPYEYEFSYNPTGAASAYRPIGTSSGYDSSEMQHFDPRFVRKAAGGGIMDIGPVQAMSDRNAAQTLMANQGQMFAKGGSTDNPADPFANDYRYPETSSQAAQTPASRAVKPVEQDPYYTMSGMSGDAYKYLMGQGSAPTAPAPAPAAAPAPVQSTVQAAPAQERKGLFGKIMQSMNPAGQTAINETMSGNRGLQMFLGQTPSSGAQAASGEWVDDTSGLIKAYDFDPVSGMMTPKAVPKVWRPYEDPTPSTAIPGLSYENMVGGYAQGGIASLARGGQSHLGDYSDGGRLLRGPGDGVSDDIPATIANKRPARLADGEFVVPARIVSELGNGSTEAGARKLYAMMDRVQKARKKSIGKNRVAVNSRTDKLLPA